MEMYPSIFTIAWLFLPSNSSGILETVEPAWEQSTDINDKWCLTISNYSYARLIRPSWFERGCVFFIKEDFINLQVYTSKNLEYIRRKANVSSISKQERLLHVVVGCFTLFHPAFSKNLTFFVLRPQNYVQPGEEEEHPEYAAPSIKRSSVQFICIWWGWKT